MILMTRLLAAIFLSLVKFLSEEGGFSPFQITFVYNFISLFFIFFWMYKKSYDIDFVKTNKFRLFAVRGVFESAGFFMLCYSIAFIPLPAFTALGFLQPIIISVMAILLLKEVSNKTSIIALVGGFIGAMIIIRPSSEGLSIEVTYRLLATLCFAICAIVIKKMTTTEHPMKIVFYMVVFMMLMSAPLAFIYWQPVTLNQLGIFIILGFLSVAIQYYMSSAFSKETLTLLMPFFFAELIFTSIISYFAFDEVITIWTVIGALIIIQSAAYSAYKTKKVAPAAQNIV